MILDKTLGYYTCDGLDFESKIHALQHSTITHKPVEWNFNRWEFGQHNWMVEPPETLDQLYQRRARQIREQYDYVIVSFSGGSDSWNIVRAFMDQGLLVDEIVSNWALDANSKYVVLDPTQRNSWNNVAEYHLNCVERIKEIQARSPATKITVNDTSRALIDTFLTADDASWTATKHEVLNPTGATNFNYKYFSEVRKRFDRDKKIAIVLGQDKPRLIIKDNQLYTYFVDKIMNLISTQDHLVEYPNCHTLFFYWSPESCDMLAKQAHTILRLINQNRRLVTVFSTTDADVQRTIQEPMLKNWLYSTWNTNWFQVHKAKGDWYSNLDYWFSRGWAGTREHAIWQAGLQHVTSSLDPKYLNKDKNGTVNGTVPFISPYYHIGTVVESPPVTV
jgi:hypothetical protein